jgi:hypothetical protein
MTLKKNPFSAGRWVTGTNFVGRTQLIENLIHSNEACDWVVGKRRVGKTSLLRQLEFLQNENIEGWHRFGLFWDIQGSYDADGLRDSLVDAIEDSQDEYPDIWDDLNFDIDEYAELACAQLLKKLMRILNKADLKLVLLIDEAEEFMNIGKQSPVLLGKLRKFFHSTGSVHTIMCSTPRLEQFHKTIETDTSPFLHGFHACYLGHLTREESSTLTSKAIEDPGVQSQIFDLTKGDPYMLQLVAKHFFEHPDLEEITRQLEANPSLIQVIEVNFDLLSEDEQDILKDVFSGKTHWDQYETAGERVTLSKLLQMGFLDQDDQESFSINSHFQNQWLSVKLDASPTFHAQHQNDPILCELNHHLICKQLLTFYKFFLELAQKGQKLISCEGCFRISQIDQSIYPDKAMLRTETLTSEEDPWIVAVEETGYLLKLYQDPKAFWALFRFFQMIEQGAKKYKETDFLDIMMQISEEATLI